LELEMDKIYELDIIYGKGNNIALAKIGGPKRHCRGRGIKKWCNNHMPRCNKKGGHLPRENIV